MNSIEILDQLIGFETVSSNSNLDLIGYVRELFTGNGIECRVIASGDGRKANLLATVGQASSPPILLSGHTDVVPVDGQSWSVPPFSMTAARGRLHGRGTADMKGFVACAVAACLDASRVDLANPLQLALSYDEEIGCIGVRSLVDLLATASPRPALCIVGEPTEMRVAIGHNGKIAARACCRGREGHSALAPTMLNALHLACDFVGVIRAEQDRLAARGSQDGGYEVPYTTLHVGRMAGGGALNIVPNFAEMDFEIRNVADDDPQALIEKLRREAGRIVAATGAAEADVEVEVTNSYPGLHMAADSAAVRLVQSVAGTFDSIKVPFGTEGGLFHRDAGIPTVVCGPGSMAQGHRPDEFITVEQMDRCDAMLGRLIEGLVDGSALEKLQA